MSEERENKLREDQKREQQSAEAADVIVGLWRQMFDEAKLRGFTEQQAMALVQTWILSQAPRGVNGTRDC